MVVQEYENFHSLIMRGQIMNTSEFLYLEQTIQFQGIYPEEISLYINM